MVLGGCCIERRAHHKRGQGYAIMENGRTGQEPRTKNQEPRTKNQEPRTGCPLGEPRTKNRVPSGESKNRDNLSSLISCLSPRQTRRACHSQKSMVARYYWCPRSSRPISRGWARRRAPPRAADADGIQIDVMDGVFVPNISCWAAGGGLAAPHGRLYARLPPDDHPARALCRRLRQGRCANHITVHVEATTHLHRTIQQIKELGATAGVALNPATPLGVLDEILPDLDVVLLMSVNPGFGGQEYIASTTDKLARMRRHPRSARARPYRAPGGWRREGREPGRGRRHRRDQHRRRVGDLQPAPDGRPGDRYAARSTIENGLNDRPRTRLLVRREPACAVGNEQH